MPGKLFIDQEIGEVMVYKRKGSKRLSLKVIGQKIKIIQPSWLSYSVGYKFAQSNKSWIKTQLSTSKLKKIEHGQKIGKNHTINFFKSHKTRTYIKNNNIDIYYNKSETFQDDEIIQKKAKEAIKKALQKEADQLLRERLNMLSTEYGYHYNGLVFKTMKTRWGSCNSKKIITLNVYLLLLPWDLIDYVLLHELTHTEHMNHSKEFWQEMEKNMTDYKLRKQELKQIHQEITFLQI